MSFLSSQNLEVIQWVTSLLSPSKNMQFCNEQIRTQPLFSPPCASATYGSARMCRRKNGDMWSNCFPEGIVNAASPNRLWFQCFRHGADLQINANGNKLIQNWNCPTFFQVMFFYIYYQIENMNRKGILWVKASEGTDMPCGFTRHPQHGMGKITFKVL